VTTEKFLLEFGFASLPDLEALKDAGLLGAPNRDKPGRAGLRDGVEDETFADKANGLADRSPGVKEDEPEEDTAWACGNPTS